MSRAQPELPTPPQKILVATDFSAGAGRALARATMLPLSRGSTLTLLDVLPKPAAARARGGASSAMRSAMC